MQTRRLFLRSGSAAGVALALAACGGGGGGGSSAAGSIRWGGSGNAVDGPVSYPFGSRLDAYAAGIRPSASNGQMDATIKSCYDAWKSVMVVDVPSIPGGKAVRFGSSPQYLTVSEGMGYGMLLTVLMAGHDPQAQSIFDGLLKTVRTRYANAIVTNVGPIGYALMDWRLDINGNSSDPGNQGWNAMDGDLDIAMALLMADRQWGSGGTWNYKQEGVNTVNAMKAYNFKPDGTSKGLATPNVSRTSDYMISHFRAFRTATGDAFWETVIDRSFYLVNLMQTQFSTVGLMPDFIVNTDTANPIPSPGFMGDYVDTEMHFFANAQRNPWRYGTDYVTSGDPRWKMVCDKMINFFKQDTGGNPARTAIGYHLNGTPMDRPYPVWTPKGMIGPQLCAAMVDGSHQAYLDALWNYNAANYTNQYYDAELQLLPMIVASGNWWQP
jgi:endo-1,4-beta-D-glucanase Y